MKLITLNIWGGHLNHSLLEFLSQRQDVDIFCLQEVYHNADKMITKEDRTVSLDIYSQIDAILPAHNGYFCPIIDNIYGIAMFVKNNIQIKSTGNYNIYHNPHYPGIGPSHHRDLQWITCCRDNTEYTFINIHGLWNGKGKNDCQDRINQSKQIITFMAGIPTPTILCGDFNLCPNTESLKMLEKNMQNLIKTYNINSTRTSYYPKAERMADYVLISHSIQINDFAVLPDEVSDHAAIYVDFCLPNQIS